MFKGGDPLPDFAMAKISGLNVTILYHTRDVQRRENEEFNFSGFPSECFVCGCLSVTSGCP